MFNRDEREKVMYKHFFKRLIDITLSLIGIVVFLPIWVLLVLAIVIDNPGPVFFTQKRVGLHKKFFNILKFRTMKTSTPHDVPTHLLENPDQYITRVGRILRKTSLDEIPQILNIFVGQMSIIGPRPALWNQDDLIAERDKYGANDVKPGLTGWAQINGRDELEIPVKARFDGEYVQKQSFLFDCKCFFGTIAKVLEHDGVVEGGTGELRKNLCKLDMEGILVSVIIATYRRDEDLCIALKSLTLQTYKQFEVILVDDNADVEWTAKVSSIVREVCSSLDIKYIVNANNIGSAAARNRGIAEAKGKYITFLDDDDVYLPEKIEMQLKDMIDSDADFGITDLYLYNESNELIDKRIRTYIKSYEIKDLMRYHLMFHMTGTDSFMFKTDYLRKIGGFPGIDLGDEFYLMKEAILGGGKFKYSNQCYIKAYVHSGEDKGLSCGECKIKGEMALYEEKKRFFSYLAKRDIKYVKMRHFAVIAFAELRRKKMVSFLVMTFKAFFASPIGCIKMVLAHK